MRNYLEACTVPTVHIGQAELPRLIMGIHPYDGCSYVDPDRDAENLQAFGRTAQVAEVLRYTVESAGITVAQVDHMLPELDRLHLQAIWEAERLAGIQIGLVAYILIPISLDGADVTYSSRAHATLYAHDERVARPGRSECHDAALSHPSKEVGRALGSECGLCREEECDEEQQRSRPARREHSVHPFASGAARVSGRRAANQWWSSRGRIGRALNSRTSAASASVMAL